MALTKGIDPSNLRLEEKILMWFKRSPVDISLSEAQERMRRLLGTRPADVTTTCVEIGTTPRRTIPSLRGELVYFPTPLPTPSPTSLPVPPVPTRQSIVAELDHLSQLATSIGDDDLACALHSCVRLVTEGRLVMSRIAHGNEGDIPDWMM